jgi:hypothetical protein
MQILIKQNPKKKEQLRLAQKKNPEQGLRRTCRMNPKRRTGERDEKEKK